MEGIFMDRLKWVGVGQNAFLSKHGFQQCHYALYQAIGVMETILLMELYAKRRLMISNNKLQTDGSFFYVSEHIENKLNISRKQKMKYQQRLVDLKVIEIVKKGMPAKNFFFINDQKILMELMPQGDKKLDDFTHGTQSKRSVNHSSPQMGQQEVPIGDTSSPQMGQQEVPIGDTNNSIYNNSKFNKRERERDLVNYNSNVKKEKKSPPSCSNLRNKIETRTNTSNDIKKADTGKISKPSDDKNRVTPDRLMNLYNKKIGPFNNKFCQIFSSTGRGNLLDIFELKQFDTLEKWNDIFTKVLNSSDFLLKAFDSSWLSDENKMINILNGKYDNNHQEERKSEKKNNFENSYFGPPESNINNNEVQRYTFTNEKNKKKNIIKSKKKSMSQTG